MTKQMAKMLKYPNNSAIAPSLKKVLDIRKGIKLIKCNLDGLLMFAMLSVATAFIKDKIAITKFKTNGTGSLFPKASLIRVTLVKSNVTTPWNIKKNL